MRTLLLLSCLIVVGCKQPSSPPSLPPEQPIGYEFPPDLVFHVHTSHDGRTSIGVQYMECNTAIGPGGLHNFVEHWGVKATDKLPPTTDSRPTTQTRAEVYVTRDVKHRLTGERYEFVHIGWLYQEGKVFWYESESGWYVGDNAVRAATIEWLPVHSRERELLHAYYDAHKKFEEDFLRDHPDAK